MFMFASIGTVLREADVASYRIYRDKVGCSPFLGPLEMRVLSNKLNTRISTYVSTMICSPLLTGSAELVGRRISQ